MKGDEKKETKGDSWEDACFIFRLLSSREM